MRLNPGPVLLILDDQSRHITYGGGTWNSIEAPHYFGGSISWPAFTATNIGSHDSDVYGSLSITFQGVSVALFGPPLHAKDSQSFMVSVDGDDAQSTTYQEVTSLNSLRWYQSPSLPDAMHRIDITRLAGISLDFILIGTESDVLLSGHVIVDDDDSVIVYSGGWVRGNSMEPGFGSVFQGGAHKTITPGASAVLNFVGTTVSVYGIYLSADNGSCEVVYTVDGYSSSQTHSVMQNLFGYTRAVNGSGNYLLFSNDTLTAGDHTLTMDIVQCINQTFVLDYIIYTPLVNQTDGANGEVTKTMKGVVVGSLVGGIVGSLLLLLIALFLMRKAILRRHRTQGRPRLGSVEPFLLQSPLRDPPNVYTPPRHARTPRRLSRAMPFVSGPSKQAMEDQLRRLQKLAMELDRELRAPAQQRFADTGRVVELRERIVELARGSGHEAVGGSQVGGSQRTLR